MKCTKATLSFIQLAPKLGLTFFGPEFPFKDKSIMKCTKGAICIPSFIQLAPKLSLTFFRPEFPFKSINTKAEICILSIIQLAPPSCTEIDTQFWMIFTDFQNEVFSSNLNPSFTKPFGNHTLCQRGRGLTRPPNYLKSP